MATRYCKDAMDGSTFCGQGCAPVAGNAVYYERHRPEQTLLYPIVAEYCPAFLDLMAAQGRALPECVQREFEDYLRYGRLGHGFLRVRCERCHAEKLVAFSCKRRDFCSSCGARRMVGSAALLVDEVLPREPLRQWVLSVPFALRFLFASQPAEMGKVLGIVYRTIATHLIKKAGLTHATGQTGAVTLIQRFGSALNLNIHFHMLFLDGVYVTGDGTTHVIFGPLDFMARLAALVSKPRVNLTRFHGVFAQQPPARAGHTGSAWSAHGRGSGQDGSGEAFGHDLCTALEARIQDRHRNVPPLRRSGEGGRSRGIRALPALKIQWLSSRSSNIWNAA